MTFTWQSVLLNCAAWVAGIFTCRMMLHSRRARMDDQRRKAPFLTTGRLAVALGVVLILMGIQQITFQRSQSADDAKAQRHDACVNAWGEAMSVWGADVVTTIGTRSDATQRLDAAKDRRVDSFADIIAVVIGARAKPPTATEKDFDHALAEFADANADLAGTQAKTDQTREDNPYRAAPKLDCKE